jgi:predicted ATP-grasp superfamily ATP-dependent carboligase
MIDKVCKEKSYLQIGNSASLNRKWEDKLELVKLSEEYAELSVVPGKIARLQDFVWEGEMVVQTARGWGGKSTFLVSNNEGLEDLKRRLGDVKAKVSPFINGRTYLNNVCVVDGEVLQSPPALQINCPNKNFSSLPLTTCGRQFGNLVLDKEQISQMREITDKVGLLMAEDGYKGYFGLDFIVEDGTGKVFLQEINARLTASSSFYTTLEIEAGRAPLLFGHIGAFLNDKSGYTSEVSYFLNNNKNDSSEVSGMQLIIRNSKVKLVKIKNELMPGIYKLDDGKFEFARSSYQVTDVKTEDEFLLISPGKGSEISPESELLRCESKFAVMEEGRVPGRLKKTLVGLKKSLLGDLVLEYSLR